MKRALKAPAFAILIILLFSCSGKQSIFVGDVADITNFKRPANITHYQWSFDTKPPASRLDPRDFIPSNYHPNVSFIPDAAGRYIVRLAMRDAEGKILHKNFIFEAEIQPDYLNSINLDTDKKKSEDAAAAQKSKSASSEKKSEPAAPKPEVTVVKTEPIIKKKTITRKPNEWQKAPNPNENPNYVVKEPDYIDAGTTVAQFKGTPRTSVKTTPAAKVPVTTPARTENPEFDLDPAPLPPPDVNVEAYEAYLERMKNQPAPQPVPVKKEMPAEAPQISSTSETQPTPSVVSASELKPGMYTLQLASSTVKAYAYEELNKLRKDGLDVYMQEAYINGALYYRIRMGAYTAYSDAKQARDYLKNTTAMDPWIDKVK